MVLSGETIQLSFVLFLPQYYICYYFLRETLTSIPLLGANTDHKLVARVSLPEMGKLG